MNAEKAWQTRNRKARATISINLLKPQVVACGIDTLHLHTVTKIMPHRCAELEEIKTAAHAARDLGEPLPIISLAGVALTCAPHGTGKGPVLLQSDDMVLICNPDPPRGFPSIVAELRSLFLWGLGYQAAVKKLEELVFHLTGTAAALEISRLDLAVDFVHWTPTPEQRGAFTCRAQRRAELHEEWRKLGGRDRVVKWFRNEAACGDACAEAVLERLLSHDECATGTHFSGKHFTGFSFGAGAIVARIYDKTREIQKSGKLWFESVWLLRGKKPGQTVWRLEFQLRRALLKEAVSDEVIDDLGELRAFQCTGKRTVKREGRTLRPPQVFKRWSTAQHELDGLFRYLSREWLSLRLPRTAKTRCRLDPRWNALRRQADFESAGNGNVWRVKLENDAIRTTGQQAGYMARGISEQFFMLGDNTPDHLDADAAVNAWVQHVRGYAKQHKGDVVERALERWAGMKERERLYDRLPIGEAA